MKFLFGDFDNYNDSIIIEAKNIEMAINIFKIRELFPEKYVSKKYVIDKDYNNALSRYEYNFKTDPKINIYSIIDDENRKLIRSILLSECCNINYSNMFPKITQSIAAPQMIDDELEEKINLPIIGNSKEVSNQDKNQLREMHDKILLQKNEYELMIRSLNDSMSVLKKEIDRKMKYIFVIETFLGINEEVIQIGSGVSASEDEPLILYQNVLYMDEEVGVWEDGGLDFSDIEIFDEWVVKNYDKFVNDKKSVRAFRVRRNKKDYGDVFANIKFNSRNFETYFLIRNGGNFYRIYSGVRIREKMFPSLAEYSEIYKKEKEWSEERAKEKVQSSHENYLYGLIAIQGLIERTEILGNSLRNFVNLLKPNGLPENKVKLIRDAEREFWLTDGKKTWQEFLKENRKDSTEGTRIVLTKAKIHDNGNHRRVEPYHPSDAPSLSQIYLIEKIEKSTYSGDFVLRYLPNDRIYEPGNWEGRLRKRRIPYRFYSDEFINFDKITIEDCDYYEKNRLEREYYLDILPILHWIKKIKIEEQKLELEFIKLIAGKLNWDEDKYKIIQDEIVHWKLKNKWKRGLMTNDALAVRMILKKLNKIKE